VDPNTKLAIFYEAFITTFAGQNHTMNGRDIEAYVAAYKEQNPTVQDIKTIIETFLKPFLKQNPTITSQDIDAFGDTFNANIRSGEFQDQADDPKCVIFNILNHYKNNLSIYSLKMPCG
jgi:predicted SnoaL-like aldol condensation-catalyzing enzyme